MADLKNKRITIKVTEAMHAAYKQYCSKKDIDLSDDIRDYIRSRITQDSK